MSGGEREGRSKGTRDLEECNAWLTEGAVIVKSLLFPLTNILSHPMLAIHVEMFIFQLSFLFLRDGKFALISFLPSPLLVVFLSC